MGYFHHPFVELEMDSDTCLVCSSTKNLHVNFED